MKTKFVKLVAVVAFLTSFGAANVAAAPIVDLNNNPVLSAAVFKSFVIGPFVQTTRTVTTLPYSETGVTANKDNQLIATADYDFYSNPNYAQFRIDYTLTNNSPQFADDYARVYNEFSHASRIQIQNTAGVDIMYSFSSELEMTAGQQEARLASNFRSSDSSQTFFNSSLNDRYLTAVNSLAFSDTGILPAGTTGHFYYSAQILKRAGFGVGNHTNANAEGFFNLEFKPTSAPVPEPTTIALLGLGILGIGLTRRRQLQAQPI